MSALAKPAAMTLGDFLAWEAQQPDRHEFVDGGIFAMTGASLVHGVLVGNLGSALRHQYHAGGCRVFQENYKVRAHDEIFYPDIVVTCEPIKRNEQLIEHPTLIAEVLSPSTERYDRGKKWTHYRNGLPSLQTFLLLSQNRVQIEAYRRNADGWHYSAHLHLDEIVPLTHPAHRLTVAEIYHDALDLLVEEPDDPT